MEKRPERLKEMTELKEERSCLEDLIHGTNGVQQCYGTSDVYRLAEVNERLAELEVEELKQEKLETEMTTDDRRNCRALLLNDLDYIRTASIVWMEKRPEPIEDLLPNIIVTAEHALYVADDLSRGTLTEDWRRIRHGEWTELVERITSGQPIY